MALQAVLDSVEGLPEPVAKEYRKGTSEEGLEGKFVLDVTAHSTGWALENVTGLKNSLGHVKGERDTAKNTLGLYGDVTPQKLQELQTELTELRKVGKDGDAKIQAQVDQKIAEVKRAIEQEKQTLQDEVDSRNHTIESLVIDGQAKAAILELDGNPDWLLHHVKEQTKVVWVDDPKTGKKVPEARVLDLANPGENNFRITLKQGSTNPMDVPELIETMKGDDRFKGAFKSEAPGGTGSQSSSTNQGGPGSDTSNMSPTDKMAAGFSKI